MNYDIFLRAHTVAATKEMGPRKRTAVSKWPEQVLVFDTETTIDTQQNLTFGAFRRCRLVEGTYICSEEGLFYADDLDTRQRSVLEDYVTTNLADIGVKSFPPKIDLKLWSRSEFVEKVFWKAIQNGAMVVGFNLPFDLSRLAVDWRKGRKGGWSLILSLRRSYKTQQIEPNPDRPRVRIRSTDSKSAFIGLARPRIAEEWPEGRFLDLHTLALALFGKSYSLDGLCEDVLKIEGKNAHKPTGKVSQPEIDYCLQDVRITTNVLNWLKQEFDQHPINLNPDRAYSPASLAKGYLDSMGVVPPKSKFKVSNRILGIAMQAYYGGRAECRIRRTSVPIVHTDFTSQYPTVNTLLGNWDVLTAANVSFEDATRSVQQLVNTVTLEGSFDANRWREFAFFALVRPDKDILPIRTAYNQQTQNIGLNRLSSTKAIWYAGPDVIASALLAHKAPKILKAIRMVPHGKQPELNPTNLRGMVAVDPAQHDFFRHVIEQRKDNKTNPSTALFLKILANSGSYGLFVEITPEKLQKAITITAFSGEESFEQSSLIVEREGRWYFPPIASLITAGGRLMLAMLERCVTDAGGTYLFCDTDSLCIVSSERGGPVKCQQSEGRRTVRALSWKEVQSIAERFKRLNPYDSGKVPDVLKVEDVNFDSSRQQQQLYGYAISAKRYALYRQTKDDLIIVDPKAHGLGYLYLPKKKKDEPDWTFEAWDYSLRETLGIHRTAPRWLDFPTMMRIVLNSPHVLDRLNHQTRPYNFLLCPMIDTVAGYPAGIDPNQFTLITPFQTKPEEWLRAEYINIHDGKVYHLALRQTPNFDKVIPQTFGYVLRLYTCHPESKSLAPDGSACSASTRGLLQRASVIAGKQRFIGKETDRRWEHGEDLSLLGHKPLEYQASGKTVVADLKLRCEMAKHGFREMMRRTGLSQHTLEKICRGQPVRQATLLRVQIAIGGLTRPTSPE